MDAGCSLAKRNADPCLEGTCGHDEDGKDDQCGQQDAKATPRSFGKPGGLADALAVQAEVQADQNQEKRRGKEVDGDHEFPAIMGKELLAGHHSGDQKEEGHEHEGDIDKNHASDLCAHSSPEQA